MRNSLIFRLGIWALCLVVLLVESCSKGGSPAPLNPCSGITITVNGIITNPSALNATDGKIIVTATGGAGFTYSINGGIFQTSTIFSGLSAGIYNVIAKNSNGCTGSNSFVLTDPNQCSGVTITIATSVVGTDPCGTSNGMITINAGGGAPPYSYQLDNSSFQSSNIFSGLAPGSYTLTVKDMNNCIGTATNISIPNLPSGPLFNQVRTLLQNNCVSCHNPSNSNGGMNWTVDCNIVMFSNRIFERAVNGNPSPMPPTGFLPASEQQKIIVWINAGASYTD